MTTEIQNDKTSATDEAVLDQATEELARVHARIGPRFRRAEARQRARGFLQGLLAASDGLGQVARSPVGSLL